MTKSANKNLTKSSKTGRITPLKINLKNVTSTSSDKKRKESSDLGSPTAKKAKTIIDRDV